MSNINRKNEKIIAVVGVSRDEEKFGFKVFNDLLRKGQNVYGVNPNTKVVLGQKIYSDLRNLPKIPNLVITVVSPKVTEKIVDECISLGIKEIWMQPGSESEKAIEKAESNGISVIHDACIMIETSKDEDLLLKL
ncbi:unnamed protein product [marine sediment metagenome]|uniref:CoA-binding domain-containing protein n=2 Tax=marine sediment metagenome TaxID=412755 RepID=X0ZG85_9ZZZZ